MVKTGLVGLGKMGISHCAILNAHPVVDLVGVCDSSKFILAALAKHGKMNCFTDYKQMIRQSDLDCIFVAAPTRFHADMVCYSLEKGLHVFVEKPFCLNSNEGKKMIDLALMHNKVNQVGYHNRFIGTFNEAKRIIARGVIGDIYHVLGEAFGPVVLKEKGSTWRSHKSEGGGCLYDYASHVINLIQFIVGTPNQVAGTVLKNIYSQDVDDAVYATLFYNNGLSGQLSVNWSDESYRKMSTQITVMGKKGKVVVDATECKIYLRQENKIEGLEKGWNIRYITDLTKSVDFYLRGEEYSAQIDHFIDCVLKGKTENVSSFESAFETDRVVEMLVADAYSRK
jgi:predicted dehydrogenase